MDSNWLTIENIDGEVVLTKCSREATGEIVIPEGVTKIEDKAFGGPGGPMEVTSVHIPKTVKFIGDRAFTFCSLASIVVDKDNPVYDSRNNCNAIVETASNTLIKGCSNTIIPNTITSIGEYAFIYCHDLKSIDIPNGVKSIGFGAFKHSGLVKVDIPDSVTFIDDAAFNNTKLKSITLPKSITSIGAPKSYRKYNMSSDSGVFAFSELESIDIPNSVNYIGFRAFACCRFTSIEIPNSVTCIGNSAFESCKLETVRIPGSVKTIDDQAFALCDNLKTVYLPNSIEYIGSEAFAYCNNLEYIEVNDNEPHGNTCKEGVIKNKAFNSAQYLKKIIIPNSIKVIEEGAFSTKERLREDNYIFHSLNVDYFHIPASVKRIEKQDWGQSGNNIKVLDFGGEIPETNNTFEGCVINELRVNVLRKNAIIPDDIVEAVNNANRRGGRIIYAAPDLCDKQSDIPGYITVTSANTDELVDINTKYIVCIEPYEIERYLTLTGSLITCAASDAERSLLKLVVYEPREMVLKKIADSLANLSKEVGGVAGLLNQIETLCQN